MAVDVESTIELDDARWIYKKILLVDDFYGRGNHLLLYLDCDEKYHTFTIFMEAGIRNNDYCCYIYPTESERLRFDNFFKRHSGRIRLIPMAAEIGEITAGDIERVSDVIKKVHDSAEGYGALRLQIDYGDIPGNSNIKAILNLEKSLCQRSGLEISTMSAFNMRHLDEDVVKELIKNHERVTLPAVDEAPVTFFPLGKEINLAPSIHVQSREDKESCMENSMDILILSLLQQCPMHGPRITKAIEQNFQSRADESCIFSTLSSLENQGYIKGVIRRGDNTKIYELTRAGNRFIERRIRECAKVQGSLRAFVSK
ncbi:MAG: helix-turn-helix transcriptional regulator [Candidatus Hydrothermarchaeaceae archaeon]